MEQGDEQLLSLLATDLDSHFRQLVEIYQRRLYLFALRMTGHPSDAEDIVQEVFLRAYHALKGFSAGKIRVVRLRRWLYAIALNVFRNRKRRSEPSSIPLDHSEGSPLLDIADQSPGPEEEAHRLESQTGAPHPSILESLDFEPLFESHAVCVLTVSVLAGSHAGPWVFHFTIQ